MTEAITRLFDSRDDALVAVDELEQAGLSSDRISLIANNSDDWHKADTEDDDDTEDGAKKGATTGGVIGGGAGLLAGLGMLAIPGLGPVVAAGWLASTAAGAIAGALVGGAAGGLLGALKDAGHSDEEANVFAEGVRRGGSLVTVKAENGEEAAIADQVLNGRGGITAQQRGDAYRETGWQSFDQNAAPYSRDQIAAERDLYREQRSFRSDSADVTEAESEFVGGTRQPMDNIRSI